MPIIFPYSSVRPVQKEMMTKVSDAVKKGEHAVIHAPTGIGKTAAVLTPALDYACQHNKVIFFLTSRHTQHEMAIKTLGHIREKSSQDFGVVDVVAKQHMCLVGGINHLSSKEFIGYCKDARETRSCQYYALTKKKDGELTDQSLALTTALSTKVNSVQSFMEEGRACTMCPYELALATAGDARVIIADYSYIFNPLMQNSVLARMKKSMSDCIVIVDEAHNVPNRITEMASDKLSSFILQRAMAEADRFEFDTTLIHLREIASLLEQFIDESEDDERAVSIEYFHQLIEEVFNYDDLIEIFFKQGEQVRKKQKRSFLLSIAEFMENWQQAKDGYARILKKVKDPQGTKVELALRCLDVGQLSAPTIGQSHSTILMSGTLHPTQMYTDVLGFEHKRTHQLSLENPFPKEHVLHWVYPKVTTQYKKRNEKQYAAMAESIKQVIKRVAGNVVVFFPSYSFREKVGQYFFVRSHCFWNKVKKHPKSEMPCSKIL